MKASELIERLRHYNPNLLVQAQAGRVLGVTPITTGDPDNSPVVTIGLLIESEPIQ